MHLSNGFFFTPCLPSRVFPSFSSIPVLHCLAYLRWTAPSSSPETEETDLTLATTLSKLRATRSDLGLKTVEWCYWTGLESNCRTNTFTEMA
jgi:hypothetical protein